MNLRPKSTALVATCRAAFATLAFGLLSAGLLPAQVTTTARFNLSDGSDQLWTPREVDLRDGTVLQSFAFDNTHQAIYTVQLTEGAASDSGNLTVTKLSWDGQTVLGYMYLTGFGHGVQIGVEPSGSDAFLWTEVDGVVSGVDSWGNKIGRFKFVSGTTLAKTSASITKYPLIVGADRTTCNVDMVHGYLIMRYRLAGSFRFRLYSLASVKAGSSSYLCDIAQPADLGTFQGFTSYGSYLYILTGNSYDSVTNPPPGNTFITVVNLNTGIVSDSQQTNAGTTLTFREPEGMAIWTSGSTRRLCFGFATQVTAGARLASVYYKDALIP